LRGAFAIAPSSTAATSAEILSSRATTALEADAAIPMLPGGMSCSRPRFVSMTAPGMPPAAAGSRLVMPGMPRSSGARLRLLSPPGIMLPIAPSEPEVSDAVAPSLLPSPSGIDVAPFDVFAFIP